MNFTQVHLMARLSGLSYQTNPDALAKGAKDLGFEWVGSVVDEGFQVIAVDGSDGSRVLAFRGTPITCGRDIEDVLKAVGDDLCLSHTDVGGGALVSSGWYGEIVKHWPALSGLIAGKTPITLTGHSLGAIEALITGAFLANSSVIVFAPPQGANEKFWQKAYDGKDTPVVVGRQHDFALGWNHLDPVTCQLSRVCHLTGGSWEWLDKWAWHDDSVSDHDVSGYISDIGGLL